MFSKTFLRFVLSAFIVFLANLFPINFRITTSRIYKFLHTSSNVTSRTCTLFEANNSSLQNIYLPQKQEIKTEIGDIFADNKLPILDFKKPISFYCSFQLINSNISPIVYNNRYDWNEINPVLYTNIQFPKEIKNIYLPTTINNSINEKKADYYKYRNPRRFTHLIWVRHRKMKKHQRIKWRKKYLSKIKRILLERNIAKEKQFRAELLAQIKEAEEFDPRVYVENILNTIDNVPKPKTRKEIVEGYKDLIRKNRSQTNVILPKFENID